MSLSPADVAFVKTRRPFCDLDPAAFTRRMPLDDVLRYETSLRRVEPGQILVRRGDYGNSAVLILAGTARVIHPSPRGGTAAKLATDPGNDPANDSGPRRPTGIQPRSLRRRLLDCFKRHRYAHVRPDPRPSQIQTPGDATPHDPPRPLYMQDFSAVLSSDDSGVAIGPGEMFGEVAAMYRTPHAATVVATEESAVLEITWQGLRELRRDKQFDASLDEHYRRHWLPMHLRENALMRYLGDDAIARVAAASTLHSHGRLRWYADYRRNAKLPVAEQIKAEPIVASEGSFPHSLLLVRAGFGRVSVDHGASVRTQAYLGAGHTFGLDAVVRNCLSAGTAVLQQSLRAVGMLDVIAVPIETFAAEVLPTIRRSDLPESLSDVLPPADRRRTARKPETSTNRRRDVGSPPNHSSPPPHVPTSLTEFIVGHRLTNGADAMVVDLDRCTGCDDCVKACGTTHGGDPRFELSGPSHGRWMFAQACMQCVDPVCMIGCPTGAITRDTASTGNVVTIDEQTCVGCKTCAAACPYDNIDMAAVVGADGQPWLDPADDSPIIKATKCDSCIGAVDGPACVAACPHDALVRLDLTHSRPLDQFLRGRP